MENSIWNNLNDIKEQVARYACETKECGIITEVQCNLITKKLDNDILTIGVIGQMKSGKSTFLNALLFQDNTLPVASTPMTAALSVITYGEKKEITAEFYTEDEWAELKMLADSENDEPKNKAAKELVMKATMSTISLHSLLGTTKSASFDELLDYVGADGKYVAVTKSVTIKYPNEMLKGVEVVDTPGFNDPVFSREKRTEEFLSKADVVILLLYSGRAFDETDKDILFEKVANVGMGKVLIGINKYDLAYENGEDEEQIRQHVIEEIKKTLREKKDPVLNQLLGNISPILISAQMALLGEMPMKKILSDEDLKWHYQRTKDIFETDNQTVLFQKSYLQNLLNAIDEILAHNKFEILIRKPLNEIQAAANAKVIELNSKKLRLKEEEQTFSMTDEELETRLRECKRAEKKILRTIESCRIDLSDKANQKVYDTKFKIKSDRNNLVHHLHGIIESEKVKDIKEKIEFELRTKSLSIQHEYKSLMKDIKHVFLDQSNTMLEGIAEHMRYFTGDEEITIDYTNCCREKLQEFNNLDLENFFLPEIEKGVKRGVFNGVLVFVAGGLIGSGLREVWYQTYQKNEYRERAHKEIDKLLLDSEINQSFQPALERIETYINFFRLNLLENLLAPIRENLEKAKLEEFDKETRLNEIGLEKLQLEGTINAIRMQLDLINNYTKSLI